jgi:hypothetical protein
MNRVIIVVSALSLMVPFSAHAAETWNCHFGTLEGDGLWSASGDKLSYAVPTDRVKMRSTATIARDDATTLIALTDTNRFGYFEVIIIDKRSPISVKMVNLNTRTDTEDHRAGACTATSQP